MQQSNRVWIQTALTPSLLPLSGSRLEQTSSYFHSRYTKEAKLIVGDADKLGGVCLQEQRQRILA